MRNKILFTFILSSSLNTCFALEAQHGKWLSHKEWTTGNIAVTFADQDDHPSKFTSISNNPISPLEDHPPFPSRSDQFNSIAAKNEFFPNEGIVGEKSTFYGWTDTEISNNSYAPQIYTILTAICVEIAPRTRYCGFSEDKMSIDSVSGVQLHKMPRLEYKYEKAGTYKIWLYTRVIKDPDLDTRVITDSFAKGVIKINDA